jgi:transposase InsO family protein
MKYGKIEGGIFSDKNLKYIGVDILGPLKTKHFTSSFKSEYFYIVVIVDLASRWIEIDIVNNIRYRTIINSIEKEVIKKFGPPEKLLSDRGRQFISTEFNDFIIKNKIKHVLTSPYNPPQIQ